MTTKDEEAWTVEMGCECWDWERDYKSPLYTEHHRRCHRHAERTEFDAAWAITKLIEAIERWASDLDGIPDFVRPAYDMACRVTGRNEVPDGR